MDRMILIHEIVYLCRTNTTPKMYFQRRTRMYTQRSPQREKYWEPVSNIRAWQEGKQHIKAVMELLKMIIRCIILLRHGLHQVDLPAKHIWGGN